MKQQQFTWRKSQWVVAAVLAAGLSGCGSDGGGSDVQMIDLTAANRDSVSHATSAGILAMSPVGSLTSGAGPLGTDGSRAQAAAVQPSAWFGKVLAVLAPASPAQAASQTRKRALALSAPAVENCTVSGTMSVTVDDRDNSLSLSNGDVVSIAFSNCRDTAFDTIDGTAAITFTQVDANSFGGRMVFSQLSEVTANHSVALSGAALISYSQASGSTQEVTHLSADGPVVVSVTTHQFTDTVTLQNGFAETATYDAAAVPPLGLSVPGRTQSSASGRIHSAAAGGLFDVSTDAGAPITQYDAEANPRSGLVRVQGATGTLVMTALSADAVRLELDADGNGSFESTETVTWDWLL